MRVDVIRLGYMGLPIESLFGTKYAVVGFDIKQLHVNELNSGKVSTLEVEDELSKRMPVSETGDKAGLFCTLILC